MTDKRRIYGQLVRFRCVDIVEVVACITRKVKIGRIAQVNDSCVAPPPTPAATAYIGTNTIIKTANARLFTDLSHSHYSIFFSTKLQSRCLSRVQNMVSA